MQHRLHCQTSTKNTLTQNAGTRTPPHTHTPLEEVCKGPAGEDAKRPTADKIHRIFPLQQRAERATVTPTATQEHSPLLRNFLANIVGHEVFEGQAVAVRHTACKREGKYRGAQRARLYNPLCKIYMRSTISTYAQSVGVLQCRNMQTMHNSGGKHIGRSLGMQE